MPTGLLCPWEPGPAWRWAWIPSSFASDWCRNPKSEGKCMKTVHRDLMEVRTATCLQGHRKEGGRWPVSHPAGMFNTPPLCLPSCPGLATPITDIGGPVRSMAPTLGAFLAGAMDPVFPLGVVKQIQTLEVCEANNVSSNTVNPAPPLPPSPPPSQTTPAQGSQHVTA